MVSIIHKSVYKRRFLNKFTYIFFEYILITPIKYIIWFIFFRRLVQLWPSNGSTLMWRSLHGIRQGWIVNRFESDTYFGRRLGIVWQRVLAIILPMVDLTLAQRRVDHTVPVCSLSKSESVKFTGERRICTVFPVNFTDSDIGSK